MIRYRICSFVLLLLLYSAKLACQEVSSTVPLEDVLSTLKEIYQIDFNYSSSLIEKSEIRLPIKPLANLTDYLSYLNSNTNLKFDRISANSISIRLKEIVLCGSVRDKNTGEVLPYATISTGTVNTISDEEGLFNLNISDWGEVVTIEHIGYRELKRDAKFFSTNDCPPIHLVPDPTQLAEIVVYDYLIRGMDRLDNGSVQIDFDRFTILPGLIENDVLHAVQVLPGISSVDETVSNLNIRGGSNDQNLITWDGIKMYQTGHFFGLISMYNPHITKKVSLWKNGSVPSMTDGVSGTISMETERKISEATQAKIGVNFIDANGFMDLPLSAKASLQIATRKSINSFIKTPTYENYYERAVQDTEIEGESNRGEQNDPKFDFHDASLRLLYHPSKKDRFRFNFIRTGNVISVREEDAEESQSVARSSNLSQFSTAGGINYWRDWNRGLFSEISIYETDYSLKSVNRILLEDQRFLQRNEVSESGLGLKITKKFSSRTQLESGYQFTETKVSNLDDVDEPRYVLLQADVVRSHALFSQIGLKSRSRSTALDLGLRTEYLDGLEIFLVEPRLRFVQKLWGPFTFEMLGELKHQYTSQIINFQDDFLGLEKRRWQLSDGSSIPLITSEQISLGLGYRQKDWLLNMTTFYKRLEGITTQSQGFRDQYEFVKTSGSSPTSGIDLLVRRQLENATLWLSYSFMNSDYSFEILPDKQFPSNFDITHSLSVGGSLELGKWILAPGLQWRTGRPYTPVLDTNRQANGSIVYAEANSASLKEYLRLDISSKYVFDIGRKTIGTLGISIWNTLNHANTNDVHFRMVDGQNLQRFEQNGLGLTPNVSFRIDFK